MTKSGNAALALALVLVSLARPLFAASAADTATARELYKEGADALDAGNAAVAADKLAAAWSLLKTPVIGLKLAMADEKLGKLIEAREAALAVVRLARAPDETALSTTARGDADRLAASLGQRVPHVLIVLKGASVDDANVTLDGEAIPPVALKVARQADPGTHTVVATMVDGRRAEATVTLHESENGQVVVEVPPAPEAPKKIEVQPTPTPAQPLPAEPAVHAGGLSPLVWVGVAISGVGLGVGAIFGGMTFNAKSSLSNKCTIPSSDDKAICPTSAASDLSFAQTAATVSTIGFVALGVGVGVLVTGLIIGGHKDATHKAAIVPIIGPVSGVAGVF